MELFACDAKEKNGILCDTSKYRVRIVVVQHEEKRIRQKLFLCKNHDNYFKTAKQSVWATFLLSLLPTAILDGNPWIVDKILSPFIKNKKPVR